jgi:hypothetical protein
MYFAAGVYLSEAQNPIPPPFTHCMRVYSILIHRGKGGGGGELNQRECKRGNSSLSCVVIPTGLNVSPVYKL